MAGSISALAPPGQVTHTHTHTAAWAWEREVHGRRAGMNSQEMELWGARKTPLRHRWGVGCFGKDYSKSMYVQSEWWVEAMLLSTLS